MEPNGELITNNSRRQDQFSIQSIIGSYLFYRYLAIRDNNGEFAAISKTIEALDGYDEAILDRSLPSFMDEPLLQKPLPSPVLVPVNYEKVFPEFLPAVCKKVCVPVLQKCDTILHSTI